MTDTPSPPEILHPVLASTDAEAGAANPQGKGQVGFLADWQNASPRGVVAKRSPQILADYFTSLLVLSADFKFKPAFETNYYLYWHKERWSLSLVSPDDWDTADRRDAYAGRCVLHADSTWSIAPSENLAERGPVAAAVASFYDAFVDRLGSEKPLEFELPFYEAQLPYYQRLFASALSRSIRQSLAEGGQLSIESRNWLQNLPVDVTRLLG